MYQCTQIRRRRISQSLILSKILLSNRSVGPVVPLPPYLPNSLIHQIKTSALEEIEDLKTEITMLSEKLPGFDSPRLLRRLSRYLSSQNSLRSQPEEGNTKQPNIPSIDESVPNRRIPMKLTNITPVQLTQVEDSVRHKSEIIRTLNPDILDKWYCRTSTTHPDISFLQPVSLVLPGITRFDDQNRRQAELKSWLSDAHRIRCLLLRFSNRKQVMNSSSTSFRLSDIELSAQNTELIETKTDTDTTSSRQTVGNDEPPHAESDLSFQSEVERQTELILQNTELNSDCFVHVRYHQDNKASRIQPPTADVTATWRSRSLSLASWSTTRTNPLSSASSSTSMKNDFLSSAFNESLLRAKHIVDWARLRVPANNQTHYELEKTPFITMDDQINCSQSYLDPTTFQEHAIYLDDMCRNLRNKFSQSLTEEIERRHRIDTESMKMNKMQDLPHWCCEFEISAHIEAMEMLPRVIYRMIGSSTMSLNLLNLLSYLCFELSTQMNDSVISDNYDGLRTALHTAITEATYEQSAQHPLIIILDGIENLEECKKRKNNFPVSWIPITWMIHKPNLNCPVIFILSTTSGPDEVACFNKLLHSKINQYSVQNENDSSSQSNKYYRIHLEELDLDSMEQCVTLWLQNTEYSKSNENILSRLKDINKKFQPFQLKILIKLLESENQMVNDILRNSKELTNQQLFNSLLIYAGNVYGFKRVQFILGHLVLSRWGLTDEDLINIFWASLPYLSQTTRSLKALNNSQNPSSITSKHHRMSVQDTRLELWSIEKCERVYITRNWLFRFLNEFLNSLGILIYTRSPPYGCYVLFNVCQRFFRYWLEKHYLDNKTKSDFHVLQTNTFYHQHKLISSAFDSKSHGAKYKSLMETIHWRWIYEVPYHLSKLERLHHLKSFCLCNSFWLNYKLQMSLFTDYSSSIIQNILDEIVSCLSFTESSNNDQQETDTEGDTPLLSDQYVQKALKHINNNPDVGIVVSILIQWRHKLSRDPFLLNNILINGLDQFFKLQQIKIENDDADPSNSLPSKEDQVNMIQKSLNSLIESIHKLNEVLNNSVPSPINFKICTNLCTDEQFSGCLTSKSLTLSESVGLSCAKNKIHINAIAFSTSKELLAYSARDLINNTTTLDIWNVIGNFRISSIFLPCDIIQTINELIWIASDEAILGIETPTQRILVWPIKMNNNSTTLGDYYSLPEDSSHGGTDLRTIKENCSVYVAETGRQGTAYIIILQQGICKLSVWLWKDCSLNHLFGPVSLVDIPQSIFQSDKPENKILRSMSLPNPVKSNTELFLTASVLENNQLQVICGARGDSHATMFSINLKTDYHFDFIQPPKQKCLKCPNQGTRLLAISSGLHKPIALASRSPSNILPNEDVVGCIDIFDQATGNFIQRIESSNLNVFSPMEPCSKIFGLLSYSSLPKLNIYNEPATGQIITVVQNPSRRERRKLFSNYQYYSDENENISGMEVVVWDVNKSTSTVLPPEHLFPYLIHEQYTFISPFTSAFKDIHHLTMVKPILEDMGYCLMNCNPTKALARKFTHQVSMKHEDTPKIISSLYILEKKFDNIGFISYDPTHGEISVGIMYPPSDIIADWSTKHFPVKSFEKSQWTNRDLFIFDGSILITLEKLEYSAVVEECREVYQRMNVYEIVRSSPNEFSLQHIRHLSDVFIIPSKVTEYTIFHPVDKDGTPYLIGFNETRSHFVAYSLVNGQIIWRLKPDFTVYQEYSTSAGSRAINEPQKSQDAISRLPNTTVENSYSVVTEVLWWQVMVQTVLVYFFSVNFSM
ncbi:unnamed protein product [Heterobilharzia americana]|nr:unnamed protein product [Heterobilharzia americana]